MSFRDRNAPASAKFPSFGTTVSGTVLSISEAPVPEFVNGRPAGPKFNVDGSVFTQTDIVLETLENKKVVLHTGGAMFDAIADAIDAAGLRDLVAGHKLSVTYTSDGPKPAGSDFPPKQYTAEVAAANGALSTDTATPAPAA